VHSWLKAFLNATVKAIYWAEHQTNEVFARKEEQKEIGRLEHNKVRRLHQLYVSHL